MIRQPYYDLNAISALTSVPLRQRMYETAKMFAKMGYEEHELVLMDPSVYDNWDVVPRSIVNE